ncbi:MAG: leucyl aminopeptidase [Bacteroidota bacterium]
MKITLTSTSQQTPETVIISIAQGETYDLALEAVAKEITTSLATLQNDFKAEHGELLVVYNNTGQRLILLGLGKYPGFGEILKAYRSLTYKWRNKLGSTIGLSFLHQNLPAEENATKWIEAAVNGCWLSTYQIGRFKTKNGKEHPFKAPDATLTIFIAEDQPTATLRKAAAEGLAIAETQGRILDLVNAPANKKTPQVIGEWAARSGQTYGYKVQVLDKPAIEKLGLHALLAVNRGSEDPAVFIIMEYVPDDIPVDQLKTVGMVGKGVTFDTGGVSIKPSTNMHFMKSDMGGAAAVLGTMETAAKLQLPVHLIGIVPATDNSVGSTAIKPSDVIDSYSGKTIEIIDTDAEGRLILSDGIAYLKKHFSPDVIIDLATLTGSAVRTFGYHAAALFSNNDSLAQKLLEAGHQTGERAWQLPIWEIYQDHLKSDVADIKNYSGRPISGAIDAAKFLQFFVDGHPCWAHFDIAGVAFADQEFSGQKSATAFGIRLLTTFLKTANQVI